MAVVSYQIRKADLTVSADPAGNGIQVQKLGYGQELTEGEKETHTVNGKVVDFRLSAQDMISGVVVSYERNGSSIPVTGKWKWMLTDETGEPYSQPLPVGKRQIKAEFIPEEKQRGNLNPVSYSFLVEVVMAVPDASSCAFETINVIGIGALNVPLTLCKLDQPQPVNPNNGEKVNGVWNWEDPEMILKAGIPQSYNVAFTPTDSGNYGTVNSSAEVNAANTQMSTVEVQYSSEEAVVSIKRQVVGIWGTTRKYSFLIDVSTPAGTNAGNMTFSEVQIVMGNETASCRVDASGNYVYTNPGLMTVTYHSSLKIVEIVMERALTAKPEIVYMTQTTGTQSLEADETKTAAVSTTSRKGKKARRKPEKTAESESETAAAETEAVTEPQTEAPEPSTEEVTEPTTEPVTEKTTEAGTEAPEPEKQTETPATEETTEAAEPATESQTAAPEPAPEPSTEPQTEKQTETAAPEPSTEPQTEAAAEPQTEAILPEPATEPMTEAPEPATEVQTELASELQSESLQTEAMNTEGAEMPLPEEG